MKGRISNIHTSRTVFSPAFTLIELLVVISVIAVLMAVLIPVLGRVREVGQRAVCLSNLRQLTTAWLLYADDHDGQLVSGKGHVEIYNGKYTIEGWVGEAFVLPESQNSFLSNPDKGTLWPYLKDVGVYHCPRADKLGLPFLGNTYAIMGGANGGGADGVFKTASHLGKRVGKTVIKLTNLNEIVSPGAAERGVFIDQGGPSGGTFAVDYILPRYRQKFPSRHALGTTISVADGHGEYWKWRGQETLDIMPSKEGFDHGFSPQTQDGLYDLQRMQKIMWGRLGYTLENEGG
jgi:prepilin-type N-terminal cleavage/methylation domain-containing protein